MSEERKPPAREELPENERIAFEEWERRCHLQIENPQDYALALAAWRHEETA